MAMTEGNWTYATGLTSTGTTISSIETLVDELIALIQAADAGWSVATASTQYATATAVWARLTHTSGPALIIVGTIAATGAGTQIDAANTWDGAAVQVSSAGSRGRIWLAWEPTGVTAPSNDPSSAAFFAAVTDFRLVPLVVVGSWSTTQRRLHVLANDEGGLMVAVQNTVGDGSTIVSLWAAATDLIAVSPHTGDTFDAAMITITNTSSAATLTLSTDTIAGQCLNAAGTGRVTLNEYDTCKSMVAGNAQIGSTVVFAPLAVYRDAADNASTGVIASNGIKGWVNPYALRICPAIGAKTPIAIGGTANYINWTANFASGWKSTNAVV